jgi:hypothetical protein
VALRVTSAQEMRRLGEEFKLLGDEGKWMRTELFKGMQRATRPVKQAARDSALAKLPDGGGLNKYVASSRIVTKISITGRRVGVRVTGSKHNVRSASVERGRKQHRKNAKAAGKKAEIPKDPNLTVDLWAINRGKLRHPLFGARGEDQWFDQDVKSGWWTDAMTGPAADACRKEAGKAVARALAILGRS